MHSSLRMSVVVAVLAAGSVGAGPASGVSVGQSTDKLGAIDLPSGMRIVIEEDHSKPIVAVVAVINAGEQKTRLGRKASPISSNTSPFAQSRMGGFSAPISSISLGRRAGTGPRPMT